MGKIEIDVKEKSSGTGDMMVGGVIVVLILSFLFVIIAILVAFILIGLIWGLFVCFRNYCCGVVTHGLHIGKAIALAWKRNIESAKYFFDKAKYYDHILPILVKPFLVLVGIGDIVMETLLFPVCIVLHLAGLLVYLPFWGVIKMIKSKSLKK